MRADEFTCMCGRGLWIDEGKFFMMDDNGFWSGEITHCPKCRRSLKEQLGDKQPNLCSSKYSYIYAGKKEGGGNGK